MWYQHYWSNEGRLWLKSVRVRTRSRTLASTHTQTHVRARTNCTHNQALREKETTACLCAIKKKKKTHVITSWRQYEESKLWNSSHVFPMTIELFVLSPLVRTSILYTQLSPFESLICVPRVHQHSFFAIFRIQLSLSLLPRSGEVRTQKSKSHLVRTQNLNVLPPKLALDATLTAMDFFVADFSLSGPFTCIFSKTSPDFSCVGCG